MFWVRLSSGGVVVRALVDPKPRLPFSLGPRTFEKKTRRFEGGLGKPHRKGPSERGKVVGCAGDAGAGLGLVSRAAFISEPATRSAPRSGVAPPVSFAVVGARIRGFGGSLSISEATK